MEKRTLLVILLTVITLCYKNPDILHQISLNSSKNSRLNGEKTSCYNSVKFLLETITLSDENEISEAISKMELQLKTIDELENNIKDKIKSNKFPILYTCYLVQHYQNHYFIIEYYEGYIYFFQSFQRVYTLSTYQHMKKMKLEIFFNELKTLIQEPKKVSAIQNLFCYEKSISLDFHEIFQDKKRSCSYIIAYMLLNDHDISTAEMYLNAGLPGDNAHIKKAENKLKEHINDASELKFSFSFFDVSDLNLKDLNTCVPKKSYLNCLIFKK